MLDHPCILDAAASSIVLNVAACVRLPPRMPVDAHPLIY
jgi:hypothetical protein